MRRFGIIGVIALTGCLTLGACGQEQVTPAAPASGPAVAQTAASEPSNADAHPSDPASSTAPSSPAAKPSETASATPTAASSVDATSFVAVGSLGKGHYFTSGALRCGIVPMNVGCQSTELVANRPKCDDPKSKAPYVAEDHSEPSEDGCTTQGIYVTEKPAVELKPGQRLTVGKVSCEAVEVGSVVCTTETATITANSKVFDYKAK